MFIALHNALRAAASGLSERDGSLGNEITESRNYFDSRGRCTGLRIDSKVVSPQNKPRTT